MFSYIFNRANIYSYIFTSLSVLWCCLSNQGCYFEFYFYQKSLKPPLSTVNKNQVVGEYYRASANTKNNSRYSLWECRLSMCIIDSLYVEKKTQAIVIRLTRRFLGRQMGFIVFIMFIVQFLWWNSLDDYVLELMFVKLWFAFVVCVGVTYTPYPKTLTPFYDLNPDLS